MFLWLHLWHLCRLMVSTLYCRHHPENGLDFWKAPSVCPPSFAFRHALEKYWWRLSCWPEFCSCCDWTLSYGRGVWLVLPSWCSDVFCRGLLSWFCSRDLSPSSLDVRWFIRSVQICSGPKLQSDIMYIVLRGRRKIGNCLQMPSGRVQWTTSIIAC